MPLRLSPDRFGLERFHRFHRFFSPAIAFSGVLAVCALVAGGSPAVLAQSVESPAVEPQPATTAGADAEVGRVVFLTGQARVLAADGTSRPLRDGDPLQVGERIETQADTWVHLRMVDRAFVALRPDSRFLVKRYEFDARRPQESRIRLDLERGNARTVSGQGGEAARDQYRFGTPVAAIGLRGTDYTVRTTDTTTRVSVARGAVIVTPLGAGCSAESFGPCQTLASRELSAGIPHAYLEISAQQPLPVLVAPAQDPAGAAGQNPQPAPPEPEAGAAPAEPVAVASGSAEDPAQLDPASSAPARSGAPESPDEPSAPSASAASASAPSASAGPGAGGATKPGGSASATSAETVSDVNAGRILIAAGGASWPADVVAPGADIPLVWGRWSNHAGGAGSPALVSLLPGRDVLFGNEVFGLLRNRFDTTLPTQGVADFRYASSEAYAVQGGQMSAAAILGGDLSVDFRQRTFQTGLAVRYGETLESLQAQGVVDSAGLLTSVRGSWPMTVRGGLSADLQSAAYLFDKPISGGSLLGAVRWAR